MKTLDPAYDPPKANVFLNYEFQQQNEKFNKLIDLIPSECLCGENDEIPGVSGFKIPANIYESSV